MIGVDTNILVRYFLQDDPDQCSAVNRFFEKAESNADTLFVNAIVLCELCWVLERVYGYPKTDIAAILEKMMRSPYFIIENVESVWEAMIAYANSGIDFADLLIGKINHRSGCGHTVTFDKKASKLSEFLLLSQTSA